MNAMDKAEPAYRPMGSVEMCKAVQAHYERKYMDSKGKMEHYKDIVVWGCKYSLAYDTQFEGSRSWYLYQMIKLYEDWADFYEAVSGCLRLCCSGPRWKFVQYAELCARMAAGGYEPAGQKLDAVYAYLLDVLSQRKYSSGSSAFLERDNMEALCIVKVVFQYGYPGAARQEYVRIVNDLGGLFQKNEKLYSYEYFSGFQQECEMYLGRTEVHRLLNLYGDREGIVAYRKSMAAVRHKQYARSGDRESLSADAVYERLCRGEWTGAGRDIPLYMARTFQNLGKQEEFERLARLYAEEQEIPVRTELLRLLTNHYGAELLDVDCLIRDTRSESEELRRCAYLALGCIQSEEVRAFALELLSGNLEEDEKGYAVNMLLRNYMSKDKELVIQCVKTVPVSRDRDEWHFVFHQVLDLLGNQKVKEPPRELLPYMYETTLCSHCREYIVLEMGKRQMLTEELLEECRYDCNGVICRYAEERIAGRKRQEALGVITGSSYTGHGR